MKVTLQIPNKVQKCFHIVFVSVSLPKIYWAYFHLAEQCNLRYQSKDTLEVLEENLVAWMFCFSINRNRVKPKQIANMATLLLSLVWWHLSFSCINEPQESENHQTGFVARQNVDLYKEPHRSKCTLQGEQDECLGENEDCLDLKHCTEPSKNCYLFR